MSTPAQYSVLKKTLYHTIPTFNNPDKESFCKHCGKRRKCWLPAFSPFPSMFSTISTKTEMIILAKLNLFSANAFSLVKAKVLSSGKELKLLAVF